MQLINCDTNNTLLSHVVVADTFWARFRGLMLQRDFPQDFGFWLQPCSSVHTLFMRAPIDIYFVAADGRINEIRQGVKPWSFAVPRERSYSVLEIPSSQVASNQITVGMQVCLRE